MFKIILVFFNISTTQQNLSQKDHVGWGSRLCSPPLLEPITSVSWHCGSDDSAADIFMSCDRGLGCHGPAELVVQGDAVTTAAPRVSPLPRDSTTRLTSAAL